MLNRKITSDLRDLRFGTKKNNFDSILEGSEESFINEKVALNLFQKQQAEEQVMAK